MQHASAESDGKRKSLHGQWSSRLAFILAVTGSAVGLGNVWKFPYVTGQNGGGAFVLVYLGCVLLIGMPILMSEILIGRRGRRNPVATMKLLGEEEGKSGAWQVVGLAGVLAGVFILSFYSVIGGWTLAYIPKSISGAFTDSTGEVVSAVFGGLVSDWKQLAFWHTLFMGLTIFVVARGVERGLEQAVRFMVPALLLILLVLFGYSIASGSFSEGVAFLFTPDWSKVTSNTLLEAMGQAFFTLSIGMGAIMAYGAYLPEETSITGAATAVVIGDTGIALLSGLIIFPLVFANGLSPGEGPGLVFQTLPLALGQLPAGWFFSTIFFVLLAFAAWTSALGLMEPAVAWMVEHYNRSRAQAAVIVGIVIWTLGFLTVLSFNVLNNVQFAWFGRAEKGTIFNNIDHLTSNIMLPVGGMFIAIFAGWIMCRNSTAEELGGANTVYDIWRFLARVVAPIGIAWLFFDTVIKPLLPGGA